jgi:cysteine desulfurase / selenocysteine lyase
MAHTVGARVLIDGAQSVAHTPVNVCAIGCDFFVFSGHKIFGPTGVGALYARHELLEAMPPWQGGGNMIDEVTFTHTTYAPPPAKFEAGTATLADAVGLGAALDYVNRIGLERAAAHETALLHAATNGLSQIPGLRIYGNSAHKAAVVSFLIDGIPADTIGKALDRVGIAVRTGHHCAQPTMQRYGVRNMVRPSFAMYNTFEEVERLVRAVQRIRFGKQ